MLTILLSILCSTIVLSAPAPAPEKFTPPWVNLRNNKSLINYQSNLLNESVVPFLKDCYELSDTQTQTLCANYFDAVLQLNDTNYVVQQSVVEKQLKELKTDEKFCQKAPDFPVAKHYPINTNMKDLHDPQFCGFLCLEMKSAKILPKPICTYLLWMSEAIKNQTSPPVVAPTVSKSPVAPDISVGEDNTKHLAEQEAITPEKEVQKTTAVEKTGATGKKLEPVHNETLKESSVSTQAKIESPPVKISGNQSSIQQKETSNVGKVAAASPAQTPVLPNPVEENKQSTSPKQNEEEQPPNSNVDHTDDDQSLKDLPTNLGKQESIPIYQPANNEDLNENDSDPDPSEDGNVEDDEDPDDFGIAPQPNSKSKPKETPIAGPDENEADQKSSQEIFDSNYIPNANHVTDPFLEESGSNFFTYFLFGMFLCIILYVVYHNKSKILALLLEGRRNDKGRGGRRKHTAAYRKLDSNLEEAITSSASGRTTQIIY